MLLIVALRLIMIIVRIVPPHRVNTEEIGRPENIFAVVIRTYFAAGTGVVETVDLNILLINSEYLVRGSAGGWGGDSREKKDQKYSS